MNIAFTKVKLPFGWCSNMSGHKIVAEDGEWRTAEHKFQADRFSDPEIKEAIRSHRSPMVAKFFAKKHKEKMVIKPQGLQDLKNMIKILRLKIQQHPTLKEELLSTASEDVIIEDSTKRPHGSGKFWGAAFIDGKWEGQNVLGRLWMKIREEIRMTEIPIAGDLTDREDRLIK